MGWLEKRTNFWGRIKGQKIRLRVPNVDCYAATKIQLRRYVNLQGNQTRGQNADTVNLVIMWLAEGVCGGNTFWVCHMRCS